MNWWARQPNFGEAESNNKKLKEINEYYGSNKLK